MATDRKGENHRLRDRIGLQKGGLLAGNFVGHRGGSAPVRIL